MTDPSRWTSVLPSAVDASARPSSRPRGARRRQRASDGRDGGEGILSPRALSAASAAASGVAAKTHKRSKSVHESTVPFPSLFHPSSSIRTNALLSPVTGSTRAGCVARLRAPPANQREEEEETSESLLARLHATGIKRSHVQQPEHHTRANIVNVQEMGQAIGNQVEHQDDECPSRVAPSPRPPLRGNAPRTSSRGDTRPLAPPQALLPSAAGVLIPTRPSTPSASPSSSGFPRAPVVSRRPAPTSSARERRVKSASGLTGSDDTTVICPSPRKVPLTARDQFYMNQRAMTAPLTTSPRSDLRRHRPIRTTAPAMENPTSSTSTTDREIHSVRHSDLLAGTLQYRTFTETITEHLCRVAAEDNVQPDSYQSGSLDTVRPDAASRDSFLYLCRVDSNPYHLVVTNHTRINPDDYYTVSRAGITHFAHNSSEFIPLEKFERENYVYSLLVKLPFFRKYRTWKHFALWRHAINQRKRSDAYISLNRNLFFLLPHLHDALMQLRRSCLELNHHRLFDFDSAVGGGRKSIERPPGLSSPNATVQEHQPKTYTLGEFSIRLKAQKLDCERQIDLFIANAEVIAKTACEKYLFAFLQETGFNDATLGAAPGVTTSAQTTRKLRAGITTRGVTSMTKRVKTVAEALENDQEMTYTERATMRTQCRKITKFLRVVEFLISDALLQLAISSVERLQEEMSKIKDGLVPVVTTATSGGASQAAVNAALLARYKPAPLFRVDVSLQNAGPRIPPMLGVASLSKARMTRRQSITMLVNPNLHSSAAESIVKPGSPRRIENSGVVSTLDALCFTPHHEDLRSQVETLITNGLKAITNRDRLLRHPMFKMYLESSLNDGATEEEDDNDGADVGEGLSSEGMDLDILIMEDEDFVDAMRSVNTIIHEAYGRADDDCRSLCSYLTKYQENIAFGNRLGEPDFLFTVQIEELRDLLQKYTGEVLEFDVLPDTSPCGLLLLDKTRLNAQLKPSPRKCLDLLHDLIPKVIQHRNTELMDEFTNNHEKISAVPSSVEEYAASLVFRRELQSRTGDIEERYTVLRSVYQLVEDYHITLSDIDQTNAFLLSQKRSQLKTSTELFEGSIDQYTEKFGIELEARTPELVQQLAGITRTLSDCRLLNQDSEPEEMVDYLCDVEGRLTELEEAVKCHFFYEQTLGLPQSAAFEDLDDVKQNLSATLDLWKGIRQWNALTKHWDPLQFPWEVNVLEITNDVAAFYANVEAWEGQLNAEAAPLCGHLKTLVEEYRVTMPILQDLKCPSFEERHYTELMALLGFSVDPNRECNRGRNSVPTTPSTSGTESPRRMTSLPSQTASADVSGQTLNLSQLVRMNLDRFGDQINRIATEANQERLLKQSLDKIVSIWESTEFEVRPYKDSKDYSILVSFESIYAILEESLVSLTALMSSKYLAPVKEKATTWQRRLALFQETLDALIECQRKWMHLESIFSAPDIQKQLPNESTTFVHVNQYWRDFMKKTKEYRNCMKVCGAVPQTSTIGGLLGPGPSAATTVTTLGGPSLPGSNAHTGQLSLLDTLVRHNLSLEKIEKSLEDYLETKRGFFPRFYFLSNDELLEVLAHAKEPQSVQRHLCKCFDALVKLDINEDAGSAVHGAVGGSTSTISSSGGAQDILAMISPEGERVPFTRSLKARGNVEDWLNSVLSNMKVTLHRHMKACLLDYKHASRESWLFRHPAQCVAIVSYIIWTRECEMCLQSTTNMPVNQLSVWHQTICTQLNNLSRLVRTSLTKVQRSLIVSLITTDVHFRDVVENLVQKQVETDTDFLWAQQLRYYWYNDQDEVSTQQANCKLKYGYEYMGACSRLVITPLTDRCWMTITGALALGFGAAPSGPAGTGKTETSKDLAKALGTLCIVFNCSDQIDYKMMAKIFNGAVQSGSWTCLDEFNRIDIEVLSVVAQQMTTLRHGRLSGVSEVFFEGRSIPLREHHIIITMNPGYVGRTELPDNLKICFRPVAMMVPNYALIAEILLFSEGFQCAKLLAEKMTKLYKLCSEQLSQQPHYDFGMRAVKSVLLMAGTLKRAMNGSGSSHSVDSTEREESTLLIKAMENSNLPKFVDADAVLFRGILRDLFLELFVVPSVNPLEATSNTRTSHGLVESSPTPATTPVHFKNPDGEGKESSLRSPTLSMIVPSAVSDTTTVLMGEIDQQLQQQGYSGTPRWTNKLIQLFETLEMRVGVVQTGAPGSGKSVALKILRDAVTSLRERHQHTDQRFQRVTSYVLNPKSIAMNELYGFFHPMTREWTDGLASSILRQCITEKNEWLSGNRSATGESEASRGGKVCTDSNPGTFYWITFDGPIDVLWIESMNTVLDDNMTLCLANGERIKLLPKIQLLFEVADTSSASPATISRLGVVYYHPSFLGWRPFVESWIKMLVLPVARGPMDANSANGCSKAGRAAASGPTMHSRLSPHLNARLFQYFELFIDPGLEFLRSTNRIAISTCNLTFVACLCSIMESLLLYRSSSEVQVMLTTPIAASTASTTASAAAAASALEDQQNRSLDMLFVFSYVWAFGGNILVDQWKATFEVFMRGLIKANESFLSTDLFRINGKVSTKSSYANDDFFNYFVDLQHCSFVPWENHDLNTGFTLPSTRPQDGGLAPVGYSLGVPLFNVLVPTTDMVKYASLVQLIALDAMLPVMLTGSTGAGKSVLVHYLIRERIRAATGTSISRQHGASGGSSGLVLSSSPVPAQTIKSIVPVILNFSAQTSSQMTQQTIESKLVKMRKTVLAAPTGANVVLFIDDVNMPAAEIHGAQPAIELLRQLLEYGGVYDREKFFWKEICDTVLVAVGGIPGGGRHKVCPRFVRQFRAVLCMPSSDENAMQSIFVAIMSAHISAITDVSTIAATALTKPIKSVLLQTVDASIQLYETVSQTLLPRPSKCHYLFNLRDVTKLMQGVVIGTTWSSMQYPNSDDSRASARMSSDLLVKLWVSESIRVFRDRLTDAADKRWLSEQILLLANRWFSVSWALDQVYQPESDWVVSDDSEISTNEAAATVRRNSTTGMPSLDSSSLNPIVFAPRVLQHAEKTAMKSMHQPQPYEIVTSLHMFEQRLDETMTKYNQTKSYSSPMLQLVFFKDAMIHVAALARILIQPRGHALLLGSSGSGKRSLARMAIFMMGYQCFEVELTKNYGLPEFRETIKSLMLASVLGRQNASGSGDRRKTGRSSQMCVTNPSSGSSTRITPVVFLLNESQLISESFLEDINTLLNGAEIPKLFAVDEFEKAMNDVQNLLGTRQAALTASSPHYKQSVRGHVEISRKDCEKYFHTEVQRAMHIMICHSPASDLFRVRVRQFPSLINCTTIDYFDVWPRLALQYVANRFLTDQHRLADANEHSAISNEATRHALARLCMEVHQFTVNQATAYLTKCKRHVYITPKHYVDLILLVSRIYRKKQTEMESKLTRLSVGVIKLEETNALVKTLQEELVALQPILQSKTEEAEHLLEQVGVDQEEAAKVAARIALDEVHVKQQQQEVAHCQLDAQHDLDLALPALNAAVSALDSLDKKDITEVKAFIKPPQAVQVVMEAVCIMLGDKPDWDTSKRVLSRTTFMNELKEYDKDNINPTVLKKIRKYIDNPEFSVDEVKKVSRAAMSLCMWVHAIDTYARVCKEVAPKRQRLNEMNEVLADANAKLAAKQQELALVMANVEALKMQCDRTVEEKQRLIRESELTQARLHRAERLTVGLKDERVRWKASIETLSKRGKAILGDSFLAAAGISYLGPFNGSFRSTIMRHWKAVGREMLDISRSYSIVAAYGDVMELREWELLGLPSDSVSMENAVFVMNGNQQRWPLLIDPQQQATNWIKRLEAVHHLETVKAPSRDLLTIVERALTNGAPLLIEDLGEQALEPALEPLLQKAFTPASGASNPTSARRPTNYSSAPMSKFQIRVGDNVVDVNADVATSFRLYLTTRMPNPHFVADIFIRTNVINFTVTTDGLAAQLLSDVVRRERCDVEERKHNLLFSIAQDQKILQQVEIKILSLLSESKGNILDDVELIQALETAKHTSRVVTQRLQESEVTKRQLLEIRNQYQPVAVRGALLFFVISDLASVDAMYQYSLEYVRRLFIASLEDAPACKEITGRLVRLQTHVTSIVYRNISRGLFEAHRLLFSMLICLRILQLEDQIHPGELALLDVSAITSPPKTNSEPSSRSRRSTTGGRNRRTSDAEADTGPRVFEALLTIAARSAAFGPVLESYRNEPTAWTTWMDNENPYRKPLPSGNDHTLSQFQRLVLIRWLREDAWIVALHSFVEDVLGADLIDSATRKQDPRAEMAAIYDDMDNRTPCLFILSSGADPASQLTQFVREHPATIGVYPERYHLISLGQGQGPIAERMLENAMTAGHWLVLQNVHLAKSWMPRLNELLTTLQAPIAGSTRENESSTGKTEAMSEAVEVHIDFRLFLTSSPVSYFPVAVLQNSVKVTKELPKGIRANLQRTMALLDSSESSTGCGKTNTDTVPGLSGDLQSDALDAWLKRTERQLVFGLSMFHAVIQERTKYGSLGWNLTYDFSDADFLSVVTLQHRLLIDMVADRRARQTEALALDELKATNTTVHEDGDRNTDELYHEFDVQDVPWDALHFLSGEIYYGGRVTDEFDRRCLMANLLRFCSAFTMTTGIAGRMIEEVVEQEGGQEAAYPLFSLFDRNFSAPVFASQQAMVQFVDTLPTSIDAPYVFGMHPNAHVFHLKQETKRLISLVLRLQPTDVDLDETHNSDNDDEEEVGDEEECNSEQGPDKHHVAAFDQEAEQIDVCDGIRHGTRRIRSLKDLPQRRASIVNNAGSPETPEVQALTTANDIQKRLPLPHLIEPEQPATQPSAKSMKGQACELKLLDPLEVVLQQELQKCNTLLAVVHSALQDLERALHGQVPMTPSLEHVLHCLHMHHVPLPWRKLDGASIVTPTSPQSLALWVQQIQFRAEVLQYWKTHGEPAQSVFPLSVFTFPQGFFTAVLQRHARQHLVPIHQLEFEFRVLPFSFLSSTRKTAAMRRTGSIRMMERVPSTNSTTEQSSTDTLPAFDGGSGSKATAPNNVANLSAKSSTGTGHFSLTDGMDGAFISGLFLEGAQWNEERQCLCDAPPGVMHSPMPVIHVVPASIAPPPVAQTTVVVRSKRSTFSAHDTGSSSPTASFRTMQLTPSYLTVKGSASSAPADGNTVTTGTSSTRSSIAMPPTRSSSTSSPTTRSSMVNNTSTRASMAGAGPVNTMTSLWRGKYVCPVYKTQARRGTLSTTGASTNFVLAIELPSEYAAEHHVLNGTALICNLSM